MTQDQFYNSFAFILKDDQQTKHQRFIKDARDQGMSWDDLYQIFSLMKNSTWDWGVFETLEAA